MALKRCTNTETCWNRKLVSLILPLTFIIIIIIITGLPHRWDKLSNIVQISIVTSSLSLVHVLQCFTMFYNVLQCFTMLNIGALYELVQK